VSDKVCVQTKIWIAISGVSEVAIDKKAAITCCLKGLPVAKDRLRKVQLARE